MKQSPFQYLMMLQICICKECSDVQGRDRAVIPLLTVLSLFVTIAQRIADGPSKSQVGKAKNSSVIALSSMKKQMSCWVNIVILRY